MQNKIYFLIFFLFIFWSYCLYWPFKNQKKINTPAEFFLYSRQLPNWVFVLVSTGTIFSGWVFMAHPGMIFFNGFPYAMTSLSAIIIPLIGIVMMKRQWMLSKRYGFITPTEMFSTYFKSEIIRILIIIITLLFAIPFISMQLSFAGTLMSILSDDIIGPASGALLMGSVIVIYVSFIGIRSTVYIDTLQFFLFIFGIISIGWIATDLVGGWDLLNESLSRISNIKDNIFNLKINYSAYLSLPGTIKFSEVLDNEKFYNGIWTTSMVLSFSFALSGVLLSPNFTMLTFSSRNVSSFGYQQVWLSGLLMGFVLIFFTTTIGVASILLGGNSIINKSGNNISSMLPENIFPENMETVVPHFINLIGDYSPIFFGILAVCAIASFQSTSSIYLSTSAILTRDFIKKYFFKNMRAKDQILVSRIIIMFTFLTCLIVSIQSSQVILNLGSFALSMACQMLIPLLAICYFPWFTKQGISLGLIVGIFVVCLTESIGQTMLGNILAWNKWPLTIHSSVWGVVFNLIAAATISFITQEAKEINHRSKFHEFIKDYKAYSIVRRSLKPSAWIVVIAWTFFAIGPGLIVGNNFFGKPGNTESWSFGMPSIWIWQIIFWILGIFIVWFLAFKMEMSTSPSKNIMSQTEDIVSGG